MLDKLTHHHFTKHLNTEFTVATGPKKETQEWTLIEAKEVRSHGGTAKRQAFSLLFCGPGDKSAVEQGVYKFKRPGARVMTILVAPVIAKKRGEDMCYEAIFN